MPERVFWREMCPSRLITLFNAYYKPRQAQYVPAAGTTKPGEELGIYSAISQMGGL